MTVKIGDNKISIYDILKVARHNDRLELSAAAADRIKHCRTSSTRRLRQEVMYGINTVSVNWRRWLCRPTSSKCFQKLLSFRTPPVRRSLRSNTFVRLDFAPQRAVSGAFRLHLRIVETMMAMLNKVLHGCLRKGLVGACGDLSPMSQMALVMIGVGEALFRRALSAKDAMNRLV